MVAKAVHYRAEQLCPLLTSWSASNSAMTPFSGGIEWTASDIGLNRTNRSAGCRIRATSHDRRRHHLSGAEHPEYRSRATDFTEIGPVPLLTAVAPPNPPVRGLNGADYRHPKGARFQTAIHRRRFRHRIAATPMSASAHYLPVYRKRHCLSAHIESAGCNIIGFPRLPAVTVLSKDGAHAGQNWIRVGLHLRPHR